MLSTEAVGNASQAKHYFLEQDNYYIEDREAKERSEWWGKGAKALELSGQVDAEVFTTLLKGQLSGGQQLGVKLEGDIKHRPGFDLTFSVPKSVSLLALMGDDTRILGAVQQAVDKALEQIEQGCAQARVTKEGVTVYQNTQNLVVAKFLHDISREGDPQLHVHCVVMNMTQRSDGQWRSLASQSGDYGAEVTGEVNGFFERVRHHKHYYGLLFRAELAHELKQLGYTLVKTGQGLFEVEGISQKTLSAYSQRSQQIEAYMREHGYSGGKAAAVATLKTRKAKNINRETLRELWQGRSDTYQIDAFCEAKQVVERALNQEKTSPHLPVDLAAAREAVQSAIQQLSETQVAIQQIQLINTALHYAMGDSVNTEAILQAIQESQAYGELIPLNVAHPSHGLCFTTQQLLHYEREIVNAITQKHPSEQPLLSEPKVNAYLAQTDLNAEQQQAIKTLFSSNNQVMALEGPTGSGKTALLKPLVALAKLGGYHAVVLTPDKASQVHVKQQNQPPPQSFLAWLKQHLDYTQYETVPRFLNVQKKWLDAGHNVLPNTVIFVDQATGLSSKQMHDLVRITCQTGVHLITLGDAKSLLPWQSGAPFIQMLHQGVTRATLTQNCRQQHAALKTVIADTLQGNIATAFEKMGHRILSVENKDERLERMADHFASLDRDQQKKASVLMPTQRQCEEMNTAIRNRLKQQGVVSKAGIEMTVWLPKHFSETQYRIAKRYDVGQWVRFNASYKSLGIQRGDYCEIKAIQPTHNRIVLENTRGKHITWNPANLASGTLEVFETKSREVAVGDTLLWKRNDAGKALHKGERLQVAEIQDHRLRLTREHGQSIRIHVKEIQACHFDYGHAATPYQTPSDSPILIAYQNSFSRQSHQRLFYKLISQATQQAWIYTEDRHRLLSKLQSQTGNKVTALGMLLGDQPLPRDANEQTRLLEKAVSRALETVQKNSDPEKTSDSVAQDAVCYALAHLAEREAAFTHKEVLQVALEHALGGVAISKIQRAILEAEKNGDLIRGLYSQNGTDWTTREALAMEREIIQLACQSQGQLDPIASPDVIDAHVQKTQPKSEHTHAVREIANAMDQVVLMQGYAGTGKTTLLKNVEILLNQCEHALLCLAPTHTAVKELKERGLTAQTLDSYLAHCRSFQANAPLYHYQQVIAVDESSMLSNRRLRDFLLFTQLTQTRVFLIGDRQQYSAIESGKPFSLLQHSGLQVIRLTDIERQKDDTLKKAVKEVYSGQFTAAFHTLADHMIEIGQEKVGDKCIDNRPKRLEVIAEDYLSRTATERAQTLLITLGNEDRALLNALIRERLQKGRVNCTESGW
jgi:conjugative transfer relaxase protein TraI